MKRTQTWEVDLVAWAEAARGKPFIWGETDCVSLARQAVRAVYGEDPAPDLAYNSLREAMAVLAERDLPTRLGAAGFMLVEGGPIFAQNADLVVGADPETPNFPAVAVHVAGRWVVTSPERGVEIGPATLPWGLRLYRMTLDGEVRDGQGV